MITVHHLEHSRSQRILWLLEELEVPYEIEVYKRNKTTLLAPPELKKIHPLGKSPVITDDGEVVAESAVIIKHLIEKHGNGKLRPVSPEDQKRMDYWLHYAEASFMTPLLMELVFRRISEGPAPFFVRPILRTIAGEVRKAWINPELSKHLDFLEAELGKASWFAGPAISGADIILSYPLEAAREVAGSKRPRLKSFLEEIEKRPAYRRALERGGPFSVIPG